MNILKTIVEKNITVILNIEKDFLQEKEKHMPGKKKRKINLKMQIKLININ